MPVPPHVARHRDPDREKLLVAEGADVPARGQHHDGMSLAWAETSVTVSNNSKCADVAAWLARL